jgi:hypothetical protein
MYFKMTTKLPDKDCCNRYHELIQKRLDGEITPKENAELNGHMADCDGCREELVSFLTVQNLVKETIENPVEVPEGLFESLATQLEEVKPVRGFAAILAHPIFATHRSLSLVATSFVLVAILSLSVVSSFANSSNRSQDLGPGMASSHAMIHTNGGDTIVIPNDESNPDRYSAALDDLEKAYREAQGQDNASSQGYMHTSWRGKETSRSIH